MEFRESLCERLPEEIARRGLSYDPALSDPHLDYGLFLIAQDLRAEDHSLSDFNLPSYEYCWEEIVENPLLREELHYNLPEQITLAEQLCEKLNHDQRAAYTAILSKMESADPFTAHFFLHGPGGTGKTFLYRALAATLRSQGRVVICVASTGIAALLLPGGRTAHKRFLLPLDPVPGTPGQACFDFPFTASTY
jgi:hypothetical protein